MFMLKLKHMDMSNEELSQFQWNAAQPSGRHRAIPIVLGISYQVLPLFCVRFIVSLPRSSHPREGRWLPCATPSANALGSLRDIFVGITKSTKPRICSIGLSGIKPFGQ